MLTQLPPEVLENIFKYCRKRKRRLNVALCDRQHYEIMKPFLWILVRIGSKDLTADELKPALLQNIHHAQAISVRDLLGRWSVSPENVSSNVDRLLDAMNTAKVTELSICGDKNHGLPLFKFQPAPIPLPVLNLISNFSFLKYLKLADIARVEESTWDSIHVPQNLNKVVIQDCKLSDKFLKSVLENEQLCSLDIRRSQPFTNGHLHALGAGGALEELHLNTLGDKNSNFDLNLIAGLDRLEDLDLVDLNIKGGSMHHFWQGMPNLEKLKLYKVNISDEGFSGITHLENLRDLEITNCTRLSDSGFVDNVRQLGVLKKLWFDEWMFLGTLQEINEGEIPEEALDDIIGPLNDIPSLRWIHIESDERPEIMRSLCRSNLGKKWIVTEDDMDEYDLRRR